MGKCPFATHNISVVFVAQVIATILELEHVSHVVSTFKGPYIYHPIDTGFKPAVSIR